MKITVWQQFSSNHSASFTVVGKFPSVEAAQKAEAEINDILQQIETWWENLSEADHELWLERVQEQRLVTPVETALAQNYGIEWQYGLDRHIWFWDEHYYNAVQNFEHFLFIQNPNLDDFWREPQPFNYLLEKLGAEVAVFSDSSKNYPNTLLCIELSFLCPDELMAKLIEDEIRDYIATPNTSPPWATAYSEVRNIHEFTCLVRMFFQEVILISEIEQEKDADKLKRLYEKYYALPSLTMEQYGLVRAALHVTDIVYPREQQAEKYMRSKLEGLRLNISWPILSSYYTSFLNIITNWLKDQGCSEIAFNFYEVQRGG